MDGFHDGDINEGPPTPRTPLEELLDVLAAEDRRGLLTPNLHVARRTWLEATR